MVPSRPSASTAERSTRLQPAGLSSQSSSAAKQHVAGDARPRDLDIAVRDRSPSSSHLSLLGCVSLLHSRMPPHTLQKRTVGSAAPATLELRCETVTQRRLADYIGLTVRRLRADKDFTLQALADESGVSKSYLGDIEKGRKNPTTDVIEAIADALGVPARELLYHAALDEEDPFLQPEQLSLEDVAEEDAETRELTHSGPAHETLRPPASCSSSRAGCRTSLAASRPAQLLQTLVVDPVVVGDLVDDRLAAPAP